jgi:hypothetical protein
VKDSTRLGALAGLGRRDSAFRFWYAAGPAEDAGPEADTCWVNLGDEPSETDLAQGRTVTVVLPKVDLDDPWTDGFIVRPLSPTYPDRR